MSGIIWGFKYSILLFLYTVFFFVSFFFLLHHLEWYTIIPPSTSRNHHFQWEWEIIAWRGRSKRLPTTWTSLCSWVKRLVVKQTRYKKKLFFYSHIIALCINKWGSNAYAIFTVCTLGVTHFASGDTSIYIILYHCTSS